MGNIDSPRVNRLEKYRLRLRKHAGNCARTETYEKRNGAPGYLIVCRVCPNNCERYWDTRKAVKRHLSRRFRRGNRVDDYQTVMALWVIHMRVHHPEFKLPDWEIEEDAELEASEKAFFEERPLSAEELVLRKIFGDSHS